MCEDPCPKQKNSAAKLKKSAKKAAKNEIGPKLFRAPELVVKRGPYPDGPETKY